MSMNFKQSQFELFPNSVKYTQEIGKSPYPFTRLSLSMENLIVVAILFMMAMIFSFSLGVERGKKIVLNKKNVFSREKEEQNQNASQQTRNVWPLEIKRNETIAGLTSMTDPVLLARVRNEALIEPIEKFPKNAYTIQVASFKKEKYAREEALTLGKIGHQIYVIPKGNYSIVCVGNFSKKNQARNLLSKLKKKYKDCLVRRL